MKTNNGIKRGLVAICFMLLLSGCSKSWSGNILKAIDPNRVAHADPNVGYSQSLFLADQNLPPVAQRLPQQPLRVSAQGNYSDIMRLPRYDSREQFTQDYLPTYYPAFTAAQAKAIVQSAPFPREQMPKLQQLLCDPVIFYQDGVVEGNLFAGWEIQNGGKTHLITLREGMCWSDGTPVSVRDISFALEVWGTNEPFMLDKTTATIARSSSVWALGGDAEGALPQFEAIDNFTCRIQYPVADQGLALRAAFADNGYFDLLMPRHFLEKYHTLYTDKKQVWENMRLIGLLPPATNDDADAEPDASWAVLFWKLLDARLPSLRLRFPSFAAQLPTLSPWMLDPTYDGNTSEPPYTIPVPDGPKTKPIPYVRNPYYWAVDDNNQQLPYFDRLEVIDAVLAGGLETDRPSLTVGWYPESQVAMVGDGDVGTMRFINATYPQAYTSSQENIMENPKMKESAQRDMVNMQPYSVKAGQGLALTFYTDNGDSKWAAAVQDAAFRVALSAAVNRQRIIDQGFLGTVAQWIPESTSSVAYEGLNIPILWPVGLPEECVAILQSVVEDWQTIGNPYLMDETASLAYLANPAEASVRPAVGLIWSPNSHNPTLDAALLPKAWMSGGLNDAEVLDYVQAVRALASTAPEDFAEAWQQIGKQVTKMQPFIPLIEQLDAICFQIPALTLPEGKTLQAIFRQGRTWYVVQQQE